VLEVYKLTVGVGLRKDIGVALAINRFYFQLLNIFTGNPYETARDLSATLVGNFGWLDAYLLLQNLAKRVRLWECCRVFPEPGATFSGTLPLYDRAGERVVTSGVRFVTARVLWHGRAGTSSRLRTEIPFPCSSDFPSATIWRPYQQRIEEWATLHISPIETIGGNLTRSCCRRSGGLFDEIESFDVDFLPGRRISRRGVY